MMRSCYMHGHENEIDRASAALKRLVGIAATHTGGQGQCNVYQSTKDGDG